MDALLPIIRRKRRPLSPGEPAVVPRRGPTPIDSPSAFADLPPDETPMAFRASHALPARFDNARPLTRSVAFWAVELQQRRRDRRAGGGGPVLITEAGDKLIVVSGDYLIP